MKRKWEKMIQKNIDLEISMTYPVLKHNRFSYFKYGIPIFLILFCSFWIPKQNKITSNLKEDVIQMNYVSFSTSLMDDTDEYYRYEKSKNKDLIRKIPFLHNRMKNWTTECNWKECTLVYEKNSKLSIYISKKDSLLSEKNNYLKFSMIEEIPMKLTAYEDYYQALFCQNDYVYRIRLRGSGASEAKFIQILKSLLKGFQGESI